MPTAVEPVVVTMRRHHHYSSSGADSCGAKPRCSHPLALVIDPTDLELEKLEKMLAECPNCSQWSPGDGPIMAIVASRDNTPEEEPKELV